MLYSSTDPAPENQTIDANSYPPFKLVDSTIVGRITEEMDSLEGPQEEGVYILPKKMLTDSHQHLVPWLELSQRHYAVSQHTH